MTKDAILEVMVGGTGLRTKGQLIGLIKKTLIL